jgi:hypothetical protein
MGPVVAADAIDAAHREHHVAADDGHIGDGHIEGRLHVARGIAGQGAAGQGAQAECGGGLKKRSALHGVSCEPGGLGPLGMRIDSGRTDAAHKPLTAIEEQSWRSGIWREMAGDFPYVLTEVLKTACSGQVIACFVHSSICDRY